MKKTIPTIIIITLIAILGFAFWKFTFRKMSYSGKWTDLEAYYGIQDEDDFPVRIHKKLGVMEGVFLHLFAKIRYWSVFCKFSVAFCKKVKEK